MQQMVWELKEVEAMDAVNEESKAAVADILAAKKAKQAVSFA